LGDDVARGPPSLRARRRESGAAIARNVKHRIIPI
jgi:hypothetical protein